MKKRVGHNNLSEIPPKVVLGRKVCLNCDKPLPKRRRKYCKDWCSNEFFRKNNHAAMRMYLIKKVSGVCAMCTKIPIIKEENNHMSNKQFIRHMKQYFPQTTLVLTGQYCVRIHDSGLILDHIKPIAIGGEEFDEENLQILCIDCNKIKTRKDMADIAAIRNPKPLRVFPEDKTLREYA